MIQFPGPVRTETLLLLGRYGAEPHTKYPATWCFPDAPAPEEAKEHLRRQGVDFAVFFEFEPTDADSRRELAAYMALSRIEKLREVDSDLLLARNVGLQDLIASARLARELTAISPHITWRRFENDPDFLIMERVPRLPAPVTVPHAVNLSEGEDGIWAVQSDGRELLTRENSEFLMQSGIADPAFCEVDGRVRRWRRGLVFGGPVLEYLTEQNVHGVPASPSFLERIHVSS
ncbi:hypothetical protein [Streptomyces sp. NPDC058653]|uniref:hypothetical protein n=1 Tax=Streptomyces sp. NPDC058653 TaxID=3346576 RepID=UPI00366284A2